MSNLQNTKLITSPVPDLLIPNECFGRYVLKRLKEGKQNVALIDAHTENFLTYEEILNRSLSLAYNLKGLGLKKGETVAIVSSNHLNYAVVVFGAVFVGAVTHMVNNTFTIYELKTMLNISKPKYIFCNVLNKHLLLEIKNDMDCIKTIITLEDDTDQTISLNRLLETKVSLDTFEIEDADAEDSVFIFNSSGTTGLPKCVLLSHRNAVSTAILICSTNCLDFNKEEIVIMPMPMFHVYGFCFVIQGILALTKCIILEKFIPDLYLKSIEKYKATKVSCPPTLMKFLAQSPLVDRYDVSSVTDITYGSAPLVDKTEEIVGRRFNAEIRQGYGTTETMGTGIFISRHTKKAGSCGTLTPNLVAKVIDTKTLEMVGPHQPGELCLKGCTIMKGYLNDSEANKASFDEDGFYHTGDLVYYSEDKFFYLVDRLKELIKYKSYQVSPTELEGIIISYPAVLDVGVVGIPDERAGDLPMAFVVLKEEFNNILEESIKEHVAKRVSSSKWLHGGVKFVKELPRLPNGKPHRKVLKEMAIKLKENRL